MEIACTSSSAGYLHSLATGTVAEVVQVVLHVTPLRVKEVGTAFDPLQAPLKPGAEFRLAPGASEPLYETLVIVTALPVWVKEPLQSCVMVCPFAKLNFRDQPLMAVVPLFVMAILTPKPPCH